MKTKLALIAILVLAIAIGGCTPTNITPQAPPQPPEDAAATEGGESSARLNLDWDGTYQGVVPSAAGMGIKVQLVLREDAALGGMYELTYEHLTGDFEISDLTWNDWLDWRERIGSQTGTFTWDETGNIIRLDVNDWPPYFRVREGSVVQLDMQGNLITGELADNYVLARVGPSILPLPEGAREEATEGGEASARANLDWAGTYQGVVPSAAGMGIKVQLVLREDAALGGVYELTYEYLTDDAEVPEVGDAAWTEWSERIGMQSGMFTWDETGNVIRLDVNDWPPYFRVREGSVVQLDMTGNLITGVLADSYVLIKVAG